MHQPASDSYYPEAHEVWHTPYFAGLFPCAECRAKEEEEKKGRSG
jgi:hypothetical protein